MMTSYNLNLGDLLAHLEDEKLPHVEVALRNQPEIREQLETLREADQFFQQKFNRILRPDSQDLVDVVTGQASPEQELRVAAYLRQSTAGRAEMAAIREAFAEAEAEEDEEWSFGEAIDWMLKPIRQFFAQPLQVAGVRGTRDLYSEKPKDTFYVAELDARVTVYRSQSIGEEWIIEGYVTQQEEPIDGINVTLEQYDKIITSTESKDGGSFTFESIEAGNYQIKVHLEQGILIISKIELEDE